MDGRGSLNLAGTTEPLPRLLFYGFNLLSWRRRKRRRRELLEEFFISPTKIKFIRKIPLEKIKEDNYYFILFYFLFLAGVCLNCFDRAFHSF